MANDAQLRFADGVSIAANAAAEVDPVGNYFDLTSDNAKNFFPWDADIVPDPGDNGMVLEVMVTDEAMAGDGAVVTLSLYSKATASAFNAGDLIYQNVFTLGAAGIPVGKFLIKAPIPAGRITKRYLALHCGVETANLTAGKVDAALTRVKEVNDAHGAISPLA